MKTFKFKPTAQSQVARPIASRTMLAGRALALKMVYVVGIICILIAQEAHAATRTVTSISDSGVGSLRKAIQDASSGDIIVFQAGLSGTITANNGLTVDESLTIQGPSASAITVIVNNSSTVLTVRAGATVSISNLTISGGIGTTGGGISNAGTLTVQNCTISGSSASGNGGGISNSGTLTLKNCTISGNSASGNGGGISNTGTLAVQNCTISDNTASGSAGGVLNSSGVATVSSTILKKGTTGANFVNGGTLISNGYNLSDDATGPNNGTTDEINTNPLLGVLANNGGPTWTHALLAGSPALDKGKSTLATDQRGQTRPHDYTNIAPATGGDNSDIGAFESQELPNTPPTLADIAVSTNEDTTKTFNETNFTDGFSDADNDTLSKIKITSLPTSGVLRLVGNLVAVNAEITVADLSNLTYAPNEDFNGSDSFVYNASDGTAYAATGKSVNITVNAVNDAPVAADDSATINEDSGAHDIDVLSNDDDLDGIALTITAVTQGAKGTVTIIDDGVSLTYTPNADANLGDTFTYTVSDGNGGSDTATVTITITPVNDAPIATNLSAAENYTEDTALNLIDIVASDVDNATVTATLTLSNAAAGSLNTATSGAVTSTYNAGTGVWSANGAIADVNTLLAGLTFTPASNLTTDFTIATSVSDGSLSVTGSKAMTGTPVNDAPIATNLSAAENYTEDTALNLVDIVASDVDNATVTATLTLSNAAAGSLNTATSGAVTSTYNAGTGVWSANGAIANVNTLLAGLTFTPALNSTTDFIIATSVSDGSLSVTGSKAMTGTPVNDAPTAINLSAAENYTEDTALNLIDIVASDVDNATVTATLTLSNTAAGSLNTATSGAVTSTYNAGTGVWSANGAIADVNTLLAGLTYTPTLNFTTDFTIATSVSDGSLSVIGSKAMTGTPVNDAPTALNDSTTLDEDSGATAIDVLDNDTDADEDTLTITAVTQGSKGSVAITGVGTGLTYTPNANASLGDSFTYTISDGNGGEDTATVSITINSVNDAPVNTLPASVQAQRNTAFTFSATEKISVADVDAAASTIRVTLTATNGTVTLSGTTGLSFITGTGTNNGTMTFEGSITNINAALDGLTFTPTAAYVGAASLLVTTSDLGNTGSGGAKSDTDTITIDVTSNNTAPVVADISITPDEDTTFTFVETSFDAGFVDADNDTLQAIEIASLPTSGTLKLNGVDVNITDEIARADISKLTYTPSLNFHSTDSFDWNGSDGAEYSATGASVNITVEEVNDDPTLGDDFILNGNEGVHISFSAAGQDVDTDTVLTYSLVDAPPGATINPGTGRFSWTPTEAQGPGSYTFWIKVVDNEGGQALQKITITVQEVNQNPVLNLGGNKTVIGGVPFNFSFSATDADIPFYGMQVNIRNNPSWMGITQQRLLWGTAPVALDRYTASATISAYDHAGGSAHGNILFTVNPPPVVWMVTPTWTSTEGTLTYRLKNNTNQVLNSVSVVGTMQVPIKSISKSIGTASTQAHSGGKTAVYWNGFNLLPGQLATLTIKVNRPARGTNVVQTLYCLFVPHSNPALTTPDVFAP